MIKPQLSDLLERVDNRFTLCVLVGKRARKLVSGENPLVKCDSKKPVTIATNELNEGKLTYVRTKSRIK